jgi:formiminotetrahydrofolate cyclodeaminase
MQTKLTLTIDKKVIEKAKEFASKSNRSLSDIIETYLERITDKNVEDVDNELSKIIGVIKLPADFDEKKEIRSILTSKRL